jgi:hypothetical protein
MEHDRYIELVNKEISGDITREEKADLERYLAENPDARRVRDELHRTSDLLGEVGDIEPPAHLKRHIMNSVDFSQYKTEAKQPALKLSGRARRWAFRPRMVYAFAAGLAVGLVVFAVFLTGPWERYAPDRGGLYATIGAARDAGFHSIEQLPLDLPEAEGRVVLMRSADLLVFEVSLRSTHPFEVRLLYDPAQVRFNGLLPEAGWKSLTEVGEGRVSTSGSGEGRFQLSLTKVAESALPIDFQVFMSGRMLLSHIFEVGPGRDSQE